MATLIDVLTILANAPSPMTSDELAVKLWPGRKWATMPSGGSSGAHRAAGGLLCKLEKRGLVARVRQAGDPRPRWRARSEGAAIGTFRL